MPTRLPAPRHKPIDPTLWASHRKALVAHLPSQSIVILTAGSPAPVSGDATYPFVTPGDLYYLTGIRQANTALVLFPDAPHPAHRVMLFVDLPTAGKAQWEGPLHTLASAQEVSGIAHVYPYASFKEVLQRMMPHAVHVYLPSNEHPRAVGGPLPAEQELMAYCRATYPLHDYRRLAPLMRQLRAVKHPTEVALLREACRITGAAFAEAVATLQPGMMEYQVEAAFAAGILGRGADGFAYPPIVASGSNACILHYVANSSPCQAGELLLIDAGASYAGYHADMTRVVPIDGRFTPRQRVIYEAVYDLLIAAKHLLVPGATLTVYHAAVGALAEEAFVRLGLLTMEDVRKQDPTNPAYRRYLMHGISHHLGLDTHDVADLHRPLEAGMVLTVEPGCYVPAEGIGIRLENDVVVAEGGAQDLMDGLPLTADEVEALCQHSR